MAEIREEDILGQDEALMSAPVYQPGDGRGPASPEPGDAGDVGNGVSLPNGDPPAWMLWGVEDEP